MDKVVFLDRDGTINVDSGYVYKIEDWEFTDRAPEAMRMLQDAGYKLAVVTNQGAIGYGKYTEEDLAELHSYMKKRLAEFGVEIDAIAYCPHTYEENCGCVKPGIEMASHIEKAVGPIDYKDSWMVGDKYKDVGFGRGVGARTALIKGEYLDTKLATEVGKPDLLVESLYDAAVQITNGD